MQVCFFCGNEVDSTVKVFRSSTCASCGKDLRICLNCRLFSRGAHHDCLETMAEPVADKERSNFCDFFQFRDSGSASPSVDQKKRAKEDFDKLFGDGL